MKLDKIFAGLNISSLGLSVQRRRMNNIAENLANAETTKTEGGGPYRRKILQLKARSAQGFASTFQEASMPLSTTQPGHVQGADFGAQGDPATMTSIDANETVDPAPPRMVYDPGNPDADANGYVAMPNVNVVTEMVNMISASRSFEANVVAITAAKNMAKDSLEI
jgi:flagellar basal-body rod protein FlgC